MPVSLDLVCDDDFESKLRTEEMILVSPARSVIVNPQKQVSVGWRKAVGLIKTDYALCQIYVEKSYYEGAEMANISVHVDNS